MSLRLGVGSVKKKKKKKKKKGETRVAVSFFSFLKKKGNDVRFPFSLAVTLQKKNR